MMEECQTWPSTAPELYSSVHLHALAHAQAFKLQAGDLGVDARHTNPEVTTWTTTNTGRNLRSHYSTGSGKGLIS